MVPELTVHPVLGKWLYLRDGTDDFEASAQALVALARADDPRIGVESVPRRRSQATRRRAGRAARA